MDSCSKWIIFVYAAGVFSGFGLGGTYILQAHGDISSNGQLQEYTPDPKCIQFNDGKIAVVKDCQDMWKVTSWFLSKGYHIINVDVESPGSSYVFHTWVFLSR